MSAAQVSDGTTWAVFGVLTGLIVIALVLWFRYLPKIRKYKAKRSALNAISARYNQLCQERKDLVFHFYWAVDRGDTREADAYEQQVLDIDARLGKMKAEFESVKTETQPNPGTADASPRARRQSKVD